MNKKKISYLAILLIIVGTVGGLLTFQFREKNASFSENKTINSNSINSLEIKADNAEIEIEPTKNEEISLALTGENKNTPTLTAEVNNSNLVINVNKEHAFDLFTFDFYSEPTTLKILLPEKEYEALHVKTNNGAVAINDAKINTLQVNTDNGRIVLQDLQTQQTEVQSHNGRISFEYVDGTIKGETNNGRVSFKTADLERNIQLESNNGRIEVETDKDPINTTFDVSVDNGSVDILNQYSGSTVIGDGTNKIILRTDNGRVTVSK